MDALRERRRLGDRLPDVTRHLLEEILRLCRVRLERLRRELQPDGERDEVLLDALVEGALDTAAVGIGSEDEASAGCVHLGSCPSSRDRRQGAASQMSTT